MITLRSFLECDRLFSFWRSIFVATSRLFATLIPIRPVLIALVLATIPAHATSIIFKIDANKILIAADTRSGAVNGICKIRKFGHTLGAFSGNAAHYHGPTAFKMSRDWDVLADAEDAFNRVGDDPSELGDKWAEISAHHIASYADQVGPNSAIRELTSPPDNLACEGVFFSWVSSDPRFVFEGLTMTATGVKKIKSEDLPRGIERSLNNTSQELIDGRSERAKDAIRRWTSDSSKFPKNELAWRHLQFIIQETSRYDKTVSPQSEILELLPSGKAIWLSHSACPDFPKGSQTQGR
jgi:hypothetical protein